MRRSIVLAVTSIAVTFALLASACSDTTTDRSASGSTGDPTTLAALPAGAASGERTPRFTGAIVTPTSWVSTSLSPTLAVPGGTGAWKFTLSDLSDGKSGFPTRTYESSGSSTRIPATVGMAQGRVYTWTAESPGQRPVGGTFTIDVQMLDAQQSDATSGVNVGLSSGEASFSWSSHSMSSLAGKVGFGLRFQASNLPEPGVPEGWDLQGASSIQFQRINLNDDGSVGLVATNGVISNYRKVSDNSYVPVKLSGEGIDTAGIAPVLIANSDGTWSVTTKDTTSVFALSGGTSTAYLVSLSSKDHPTLGQKWTDGRLMSISDPLSGREVTFVYGGGSCPKPGNGFVAAPAGMLCQVKFWDGSTSSISYVDAPGGPSIGRIIDFPEAGSGGAEVTDLAYDAAGRIARTRSPLVAAAAAASNVISADDEQFWGSVTYDADARVASVTDSAASAGAERCSRSYDFGAGRSTGVTDSCFGREIQRVEFDPTTFFVLNSTNVVGQTMTNDWDLQSGQLRSTVSYSGLTTTHRYENGALVETRGPTKGSLSQAQVTGRAYDQTFESAPDGTPMRGLDVTYWPSATETGVDGQQELGPRVDGVLAPSLLVNWSNSPAGNDGGWSALMTGAITVNTAGDYRIASSNSTAKVRVNNVLCEKTNCDAIPLAAGPNQIRIDVSSASSEASMNVTWSGPDTGGQVVSIPADRLRPQYGYVTTTKVIDVTAQAAPSENISRSNYDDPSAGQLSSRVNQAGLRTSISYENGRGGDGGWARQSSTVDAAGNAYAFTYWGDKESAKSSCPGAKSANQGGAAKEVIAPAADGGQGPTSTQWVDDSGRVVASRIAGGATVCTTYDKAGRVSATTVIGAGQTQTSVNDLAVGGNPLIAEATMTMGELVTTTRVEIDLHGRTVRSVDRFGISAVTTYDPRTGNIATVTTTLPGSTPGTIGPSTMTSSVYDERGVLVSTAIDGKTMATITYNEDGTSRSIAHANGVTLTNGYDDALRLVSTAWNTPGGSYSNSRVVSAAGNTSSATFTALGRTSTFDYVHDEAGRLSSASISAGLVPDATAWDWTFDTSSNRLTQKVTKDGVVAGDYTYAYDRASQLVSTNDPSASGGIEYDARGNATKVGPDTFTYNAQNQLVSATDGTVTVEYLRDINGGVVTKTTTGGPDAGVINYGANGVLLDGESRPYAQQVVLPGGVSYTRHFANAAPAEWKYIAINGDAFFTTDDAGAAVGAPQVFDPYGQALTSPNAPQPGLPNSTWQAFSGNESETLRTPYQLMGARVYIPALGRFIQLDPEVGGSANGYDFADQDPINHSDPSGHGVTDWLIFGIVTLATIAVSILVPPASGFLVGAAVGAAMGAIGYVLTWGLQNAFGEATEFSVAQLGITMLASMLLGGIAGRVKWAKANRQYGPGDAKGIATQQKELVKQLPRTNFTDPAEQQAYNAAYRGQMWASDPANMQTQQLLFGIVEFDAGPRMLVADQVGLRAVSDLRGLVAAQGRLAQQQFQQALLPQQMNRFSGSSIMSLDTAASLGG